MPTGTDRLAQTAGGSTTGKIMEDVKNKVRKSAKSARKRALGKRRVKVQKRDTGMVLKRHNL